MKQLIEHRLEVAEHNLEAVNSQDHPHPETIRTLEVRIQELKDILKELEWVEVKQEPQPIVEMFYLKEDTLVWVKDKDGFIDYGSYDASIGEIHVEGRFYYAERITKKFTHFLIAEVPKF